MRKINDHVNQLQHVNVVVRRLLETAEAKIPELNRLLDQLAALKLLNDVALLGGVVISRSYSALTGVSDSGEVQVACLALPGGIGVCVFDSEEFAVLDEMADEAGRVALLKFQKFSDCGPATRALLLGHIEPLLDRLIHLIRLPRNGSAHT